MAVIDSYSEANSNSWVQNGFGSDRYGQSFTGDGSNLGSVQLYLSKSSGATGDLYVEIYAHSGTFGTSSVPTGSPLATSATVALSSLTTSLALVSFTFSGGGQIALANGTKYVLAIKVNGLSGDVNVGLDTSSPTHGGNFSQRDQEYGDWTAWSSRDLVFYVNSAEATPTFTQRNFRFRDDDGNETGATWREDEDTNDSIDVDTNFRLRFLVTSETASWAGKTFNLYYSLNSGSYAAVTGSTPVQFAASGNFSDGDDTTSQMSNSSGQPYVSDNNGMKQDAGGVTNDGSQDDMFEAEWCLLIDSAQVSNGDTIDFRLYDGTTAISAYSVTPRLTVVEASDVTTTQTITGKARVQKSVTQTVTGKSRVTKSATQTQSGKARVTASTTKTQTGKAAIQKTTTQTQAGKARVQKTATQTQDGKARLLAATHQTVDGKARVTASATKTQQGTARVQKTASQTTQGTSRIVNSATQTTTGKSRIQVTAAQTVSGRSRIQATATQTVQGKARVQQSVTQTVSGKSRVQQAVTVTQSGRSRVTATTTRTQTGLSRITASATKTQSGRSRITAAASQTQQGKGRVQATVSRTQSGQSRIQQSVIQTQFGKSRVAATVSRTQTGKASVLNLVNQTISGRAALQKLGVQTISGCARIKARLSYPLHLSVNTGEQLLDLNSGEQPIDLNTGKAFIKLTEGN